MHTTAKILPFINVGTIAALPRRPGWRLDAHEIPMTRAQEADARRRAAELLAESAKRWPEAFRK